MEKERSTRLIAVIALVVAVVALTVGFAASSRNLDITDIQGTVDLGETQLDVYFDSDQEKDNAVANVMGVGTAADSSEAGAVISNTDLNSDSFPTISGFRAKFTAKGQSVTYTFYVYNNSSLNAYLETASFLNTVNGHRTCEAIGQVDETNVNNACNDINVSLIIGGNTILSTDQYSFSTHTIAPGTWQQVQIKIAYDGTQYPEPDGDMRVTFDGIRLGYTTINQTTN